MSIVNSIQNFINLIKDKFFTSKSKNETMDEKFNYDKKKRQEKIDEILDKINQKGIKALTQSERIFLEKNS